MAEKVFVTTILKHGTHYFKNVGVQCPECEGREFRNPDSIAPNKYTLKCTNCGCEFLIAKEITESKE